MGLGWAWERFVVVVLCRQLWTNFSGELCLYFLDAGQAGAEVLRQGGDESVFGDEFPITRTDGNSKNSVTLEFPKGAAPRTWFVNVKAAAEPEAIVVNAI